MSADIAARSNLDAILSEVGEFKLRQIIQFFLICIPNILSAAFLMSYVFTANTLDYRLFNLRNNNYFYCFFIIFLQASFLMVSVVHYR